MTGDTRGNNVAIDVLGVTKVFGAADSGFRALDRVSASIRQNEFFTLLGPSGCGKTTLLRLIAGFEFPTEGQILLDGEDIAALPPYRRPVNTVFQSYALFPHLTVAKNISFGLEMLGWPAAKIASTVERMLALVKMEPMADRLTDQISGGQQQRVALARALAPNPRVLLLDEPLSALDFKLRKEMQIELKRLQGETGITFVFVTHDQEEALTMSDRIAVMSAGRILQVGSPREIYDRPTERFVADFIGETNFLEGEAKVVGDHLLEVRLDAGATVKATAPDAALHAGRTTVAVRPEHADLVPGDGPADLAGVLKNIVYFGTDTHFHMTLDNGVPFIVRQQNTPGEGSGFSIGEKVGVRLHADAAQALKD
ncbi:ABC transporter ATP-binding protein [Rhodobium gokarnense]|uniref:Spermidine/putrescine import ATP-binding protein PotA n=1 Tax=Rhodobium gokarnense TaxID=364296 RepID=A0ABT3HF13_9HYPH|nr:ABC transporter ATP-binding protein [Rhodobium gokarnense]MCW2308995.1 spermidine/putrescine transport system ATP-binding protein [Rhodobium gokarnense]